MIKFFENKDRTSSMKINIIVSFFIRFAGVAINLLFVPLTINYISSERYGIWLTVSSLIGWFSLLDIGLGNGLRNKFAEAVALNNLLLQRRLVQSAILVLIVIAIAISSIYYLFHNLIKWDEILGVSVSYREELKRLFLIIVILFSFQFVFQVINPINYALQKSSLVSMTILLGNFFGLLGILILKTYFSPSLISLGVVVMSGNVFSFFLFFSYYFFYMRSDLITNFSIPSIQELKGIFSLGVKFFVVNMAYVVQYQTSNIMISRYFSPEKVTEFNIAFKLFSVLSIVFSIIVSPVWSSVTNAEINNDFVWIENITKRLIKIWFFLCIVCFFIILVSDKIYSIWVGSLVSVPLLTTIGIAIVIIFNCFSSIFIQILNGLSMVKLQFWLSLFVIVIFIPLAYFLSVKLSFGVFGICLAIIFSNVNGLIVAPIQLNRHLKKMKKSFNFQKES